MKNFLIITRQAPYGTSYGKEALDVVLMASAFTRVSLLFLDDGVFQLKNNQSADELGIKDYSPTFAALEQYDVKDIFVSREDMQERGLTEKDLVIPVKLIEKDAIREQMQYNDVILSF